MPKIFDHIKHLDLCASMLHDLVAIKRYSLSRIARRCGVATSTIRKILNGHTFVTTPKLFTKILALYCRIFYRRGDKSSKALSWW